MSPQFLSNAYLVHDGADGPAFLVDAGGPLGPLAQAVDRARLEVTHVLVTHHHFDHVSELPAIRQRWPAIRILAHPLERDLMAGEAARGQGQAGDGGSVAGTVEAGQALDFGKLRVLPLRTPGHTAGMLSFLVFEPAKQPHPQAGSGPGGLQGGDAAVFTGDTLFRGSVGGVRAPGHTTYGDLRDSIMGTLMELPPQTVIYPGHTDRTTVGAEWDSNPFVRVWRGLDPEGTGACTALGEPATLILLAPDYDGGKKAWVRWRDGSDDIVPGSRVQAIGEGSR